MPLAYLIANFFDVNIQVIGVSPGLFKTKGKFELPGFLPRASKDLNTRGGALVLTEGSAKFSQYTEAIDIRR